MQVEAPFVQAEAPLAQADVSLDQEDASLDQEEASFDQAEASLDWAEASLDQAEVSSVPAETPLAHAQACLDQVAVSLAQALGQSPHRQTSVGLEDEIYNLGSATKIEGLVGLRLILGMGLGVGSSDYKAYGSGPEVDKDLSSGVAFRIWMGLGRRSGDGGRGYALLLQSTEYGCSHTRQPRFWAWALGLPKSLS